MNLTNRRVMIAIGIIILILCFSCSCLIFILSLVNRSLPGSYGLLPNTTSSINTVTSQSGTSVSSQSPSSSSEQATSATTAPRSTTSVAPIRTYSLYFSKLNNESTGVFAVNRSTNRTDVATYLIEQMLLGTTAEEKTAGYENRLVLADSQGKPIQFTSSTVKSAFTIELVGSTVKVDFKYRFAASGDLQYSLANAQLKQTLTQFSNIQVVETSMQGDKCWADSTGLCSN